MSSLKENIEIHELYFENMGLNLNAMKKDTSIIFKNKKRFILAIINYFFIIFVVGCYVVKFITDFNKMNEGLAVLIGGTSIIVRLLIFCTNIIRFQKLKRYTEILYKTAIISTDEVWKNGKEKANIIISFFNKIIIISCVSCLIKPLLIFIYFYIKNGLIVIEPPLHGLYPFDYHQKPLYYLIILFTNIIFILYARFGIVGVDGIFCWLVFTTSAHFQIIRKQIESVTENMQYLENDNHIEKNTIINNIKDIIRYHQKTIEIVTEIDQIFRWITFVQLTICSIHFCFLLCALQTDIDIFSKIYSFCFLTSVVTELTFYCFGGEKLQNEGESISNAIYFSVDWKHLDPNVRNTFLFFLMAAQRPTRITAYFFVANRELYLKLIKAAFSFTTFLKTTK